MTLFAYAAPAEGAALAARHPEHRFVEIGVGPARAACELTRALLLGPPPALVCLFGVCGAYPAHLGTAPPHLMPGTLCVVGSDVLADEGVESETGFASTAQLGLGPGAAFLADACSARLGEALDVPIVVGATVSTCSGTDARACALAARTQAQVETMEGGAVALVCHRLGVPWVQVRCVSNRCGDRARGGWDLRGAVTRLEAAMEQVFAVLAGVR